MALFGFAREYADLDAQYHQQPRERVPPFTPAPYMRSVTSPAEALAEAARSRRNFAFCIREPLLREVHRDAHRWWVERAAMLRREDKAWAELARAPYPVMAKAAKETA